MDLLTMLLDPKFISIVGPLGVIAVVEGYAIYKLFKIYNDLQEKRIDEWKKMNEEYQSLSTEITKTLDLVVKLSGKRNGNGDCNGK